MSSLRREAKPTWRERASIGLMTLGVGILLAVLVGTFVAVPVFLLSTPKVRPVETVSEDVAR